jgi:hypothetical protein
MKILTPATNADDVAAPDVSTRTDRDVALYVNGEADARGSSPPQDLIRVRARAAS